MQIRPATTADLPGLAEIDATIESHRYLHVEHSGEGLSAMWKLEDRPLRERRIKPYAVSDDLQFLTRQVVTGIEDGLVLVADHEDQVIAVLLAQGSQTLGTLRVLDLRVDFDHRRQGIASVLLFQAIAFAREQNLRAVTVESTADNNPLAQLLAKLLFNIAGLDMQRLTNHDLVKETVTLFWYLSLD